MKISKYLKMNFLKVAIIALSYVTINLFIFFFNYALLNSVYSIGPSFHFNVKYYLLTNILVGVIAGVLAGIALVSVNSRLFRRRSFKFAMGTTLISYVVIFILVTFVATFSNLVREYGLQGITYDTVKITLGHVFDLALLTYFILWGFITLATLFLLQVNDKFGPGMLLKFLAGNYHQPKKEEQIFMFMDMRSSTTIAEKIGNEKYFHLLNDLFSDIADTILNNEGEIYPIKDYGAVQIGYHTFYNNQEPDAAQTPVKFMMLWHRKQGEWKIKKVISLH